MTEHEMLQLLSMLIISMLTPFGFTNQPILACIWIFSLLQNSDNNAILFERGDTNENGHKKNPN